MGSLIGPPRDLPKALDAVTQVVFDDEQCFWLFEKNLLSADSKKKRRYQLLRIVRGDKLVTAFIDLGPDEDFIADQFSIPGAVPVANDRWLPVGHTVAEMQDIANNLRSQKLYRDWEPRDLNAEFKEYNEQKERFRNHKTTSGYGGQLVRS